MEEELTPLNSGFRPEEEIVVNMTGKEFAILAGSSEMLFNQNIQQVRPIRFKYHDKKTGEFVTNPTREQFENDELDKSFDPIAFMSANNLIEAFVGDVSPVVMEAGNVLAKLQQQGIDQGKGVSFVDLMEEQDKLNKSKLEIVE